MSLRGACQALHRGVTSRLMCQQVAVEVCLAGSLVGTYATHVRFLPSVCSHVPLKDVLVRGAVRAGGAGEGPCPCVCVDVFLQQGVACSAV